MIELYVVDPERGRELLQFEQDQITIGRGEDNDLVVPSGRVSWHHARLFRHEDDVFLEDLQSTNGTKLNGQKITEPVVIGYDDVITIHNVEIALWQLLDSTASRVIPVDSSMLQPVNSEPTIIPERKRHVGVTIAGDVFQTDHEELEVELPPPSVMEIPPAPTTADDAAGDTVLFPGSTDPATEFDQRQSPLVSLPSEEILEASTLEPNTSVNTADHVHRRRATPSSVMDVRPVLPEVIPPQPTNLEELGLKRGSVIDLLLKSVYFAGEISGYELSDQLCLHFGHILEPLIADLRRDELIMVKGGGGSFGAISMVYSVTAKASELVQQILDRNRYVGPAPISMNAYLKLVAGQATHRTRITRKKLSRAFSDMVLEEEVFDGVGPAMNSGMAMLIYGPPGNGKSMICQRMISCFKDLIFVPFAVEVDGAIIKLFDEHTHQPVELEAEAFSGVQLDKRYVPCRRPLIMVGGELSLDMLDMRYSSEARFYEAPIQMKANGGLLMIDDLGRQKASPKELLNRWIVPLESRVDFVSLMTGKKLEIPFDVFVVFATNLDPEELVDDAFLRRVRYKLEVERPTWERYQEIFERACAERGIPWSAQAFAHLKKRYEADGRPINACEPRNLMEALVALAEYLEENPRLEPDLLDRCYRSYFTRAKRRDS